MKLTDLELPRESLCQFSNLKNIHIQIGEIDVKLQHFTQLFVKTHWQLLMLQVRHLILEGYFPEITENGVANAKHNKTYHTSSLLSFHFIFFFNRKSKMLHLHISLPFFLRQFFPPEASYIRHGVIVQTFLRPERDTRWPSNTSPRFNGQQQRPGP